MIVTEKVPPLLIIVALGKICGRGFTVTLIVKVAPAQFPDEVVILYKAVCSAFVGLVSVPEIVPAFVALVPPVIEPVTTGLLHENVVPIGIISLLFGVNTKAVPVQTGVAILF